MRSRGGGCIQGVLALIGLGVVLVFLVFLIGFVGALNEPSNPSVTPEPPSDLSEPEATTETDGDTEPSAPARVARDIVTMDEYQRIEIGMTWDEVVAIAGQPTEELARNKIADVETVMYQWVNPFGTNMNVMFSNGEVIQKAQFGLK